MFTLDPTPSKVVLLMALVIFGGIVTMFTNSLREGKGIEILKGSAACLGVCACCVLVVYAVSWYGPLDRLNAEYKRQLSFEAIMGSQLKTLKNYLSLVIGIFVGVIHCRVTEIKNGTNPMRPLAGAVVCLLIGLATFFIANEQSKLVYDLGYSLASTLFAGIAAGMFGTLSNVELPSTQAASPR
jgi:hypothetical protein